MGWDCTWASVPRMRDRDVSRSLRPLQIVYVCTRTLTLALTGDCLRLCKGKCLSCTCMCERSLQGYFPSSSGCGRSARKLTAPPVGHGEAAAAQCPTPTVDAALCAADTPSVFLHLSAMCVCVGCLQGRLTFLHIMGLTRDCTQQGKEKDLFARSSRKEDSSKSSLTESLSMGGWGKHAALRAGVGGGQHNRLPPLPSL